MKLLGKHLSTFTFLIDVAKSLKSFCKYLSMALEEYKNHYTIFPPTEAIQIQTNALMNEHH